MMLLHSFLYAIVYISSVYSYRIYHRTHNPEATDAFTERGTFEAGSSQWVPAATFAAEVIELSKEAVKPGDLYQVALERKGDSHYTEWSVASVKAVRVLACRNFLIA